jgi:hypothetical protein
VIIDAKRIAISAPDAVAADGCENAGIRGVAPLRLTAWRLDLRRVARLCFCRRVREMPNQPTAAAPMPPIVTDIALTASSSSLTDFSHSLHVPA